MVFRGTRWTGPNIRLPSDWTPGHHIPPLSVPINAPVDEDYLKRLDIHLGTATSVGLCPKLVLSVLSISIDML